MLLTLARKWRTFAADPGAVIEYRITTPFRWRLRKYLRPLTDAWGRYRLRNEGVIEAVAAFNAKRPGESFAPDWLDMLGLYRDIRTRQPSRVLEYGSGVSTTVMAHALYRNGAGTLTTLESEGEWAAINRAALPEHLHAYCELLHVPVHPVAIDGHKVWRFAVAPVESPDYVYLDGPPGVDGRVTTADPLFLSLPENARLTIDARTINKRYLLARMPGARARYRNLLSDDSVIDVYRSPKNWAQTTE